MGRRYEVRSHPLEGAVGECALREVSRGRGTDSSSGFVLVVCGYPAIWYKYPVLGALATKHMDQEIYWRSRRRANDWHGRGGFAAWFDVTRG